MCLRNPVYINRRYVLRYHMEQLLCEINIFLIKQSLMYLNLFPGARETVRVKDFNCLIFPQIFAPHIIIIMMHVYIAPEPGNPVLRCCTVSLSLTQTCFYPAQVSPPNGAYIACCHLKAQTVPQTHSHHVLSGYVFE